MISWAISWLPRRLQTDVLECDCHLQWMITWLGDRHRRLNGSATCRTPIELKGKLLKKLTKADLVCGKWCRKICFGFFNWNKKPVSEFFLLSSSGKRIGCALALIYWAFSIFLICWIVCRQAIHLIMQQMQMSWLRECASMLLLPFIIVHISM